MVTLRELLPPESAFEDELLLPFERRQHSRLRVHLQSGREAAVLLPRGTRLRDGDRLGGVDALGQRVQVRVVAAPEEVYRVTGPDLVRAAYHLGNRHVPLQLGEGFLRLQRDPVLREMLRGLGFHVADEVAPFEPEPGAYGGGHRHGDGEAGSHGYHPH
jgi:urease accessory protein